MVSDIAVSTLICVKAQLMLRVLEVLSAVERPPNVARIAGAQLCFLLVSTSKEVLLNTHRSKLN